MEIKVEFPLDEGFLRRECPSCSREFKWHNGPTAGTPEHALQSTVYFCPYCGDSAPPDQWFTPAQIEFMEQAVTGPAMDAVADMLERELKGPGVRFKRGDPKGSTTPPPLREPPDMQIVEPPCHP